MPAEYHANVQELANNLQVLRDELRQPVKILSGYRTPEWNAHIGGAPQSQHKVAKAGDLQVAGLSPVNLHNTIERLIAEGKMKEGGLGLYPTWVHYDVRGTRARWNG